MATPSIMIIRSHPLLHFTRSRLTLRCFSEGRVLDDEERARENIYIKKMEKENIEKQKQKLESKEKTDKDIKSDEKLVLSETVRTKGSRTCKRVKITVDPPLSISEAS